jgi:hypothetical protein
MLETGTFTRGIDFHDPASATRELMNTADREAVAAKRAAMQPEDIQMLAKFGFGTATAAGASQSTMWAIGMALNRAGVGGDQSGVFERSVFGKGLAGGPKADAVYASLGIDKGMFYKKGDSSPEALAKAIDQSASNTFGVRLSPDAQKRLREKMDDPDSEVMSTKSNLVQAVIAAIQEGGKELNKNEQKEVAKSAGTQFELARGGFDGDKWFNYMLQHLSPAQAVAMFGTQQAGRFEMLQNGKFKYDEYRDQQDHAGGFNDKIAAERMEGLGAAVDRLKESLDAVSNDLVKANEGWLTPLSNAAGKVVGAFTGLTDGMKETLSVSALAAAGSGITAIGKIALTTVGSINSLAVSAERAAVALTGVGGAALPGGAAAAAAKAGMGSRVLSTVGGVASFLGGWGLAGGTAMVLGEQAIQAIPDGTGGAFKHGTGRGVNAGRPPPPPDAFWAKQPGWADHWYQSPFLTNKGTLAKEGADLRGLTDLPGSTTTWRDSAGKLGNVPEGDAKWGSGKTSTAVEVSGTVNGSAELHIGAIEVRPTAYFESLVKQAERIVNMGINGKLGTSMQGPGDNGTKPSTGTGLALGASN